MLANYEELDRGMSVIAHGGERLCALSRVLRPVDEMIRFVIGPNGEPVPDVKRKLPGRGLWITGTRSALEEAVRRNVFARGFKRNVHVPQKLEQQTEDLLVRAALDALAIAGKAGRVVSGFSKVEAAITDDSLVALIHASDAAIDGKRKIDAVLHREGTRKRPDLPIIETFTGTQLDLALNRPNVVHAALLAGPVSETFIARAKRLHRFRIGFADDEAQINAPDKGVRGIET